MTVHIKSKKPLKTLAAVTDLCRRKYRLFHTTIQVEGVEDKEANPHHFVCENDIHDWRKDWKNTVQLNECLTQTLNNVIQILGSNISISIFALIFFGRA